MDHQAAGSRQRHSPNPHNNNNATTNYGSIGNNDTNSTTREDLHTPTNEDAFGVTPTPTTATLDHQHPAAATIASPPTGNPFDFVSPTPSVLSPNTAATMTVQEKMKYFAQQQQHASKFTLIRRFVSAFFVYIMCYYFLGSSYTELFQYHPLTFTISFVGFMPEIVGLAKGLRRARTATDREWYLDRHLYYGLIMKFLSLIGFVAITVNKNKKGKSHYTTWHGKLGLLTMIILMVQIILGFVFHYRLVASHAMIARLRKAHKYAGIALLIVGCATMWLGMRTHFAERAIPNALVSFLFGIITVVLSVVAYWRE